MPEQQQPDRLPEHPGANLRVSDADRHQVAELLREAAGEGRLEVDELEERLEATYAAKTYADLVPITADLPLRGTPVAPSAVPEPRPAMPPAPTGDLPAPTTSLAMMSGCTRKGAWEVASHHTAFSLMGGVELDLREARFTAREVVITASAVMGAVDVVVNPWTTVLTLAEEWGGDLEDETEELLEELRNSTTPTRADIATGTH